MKIFGSIYSLVLATVLSGAPSLAFGEGQGGPEAESSVCPSIYCVQEDKRGDIDVGSPYFQIGIGRGVNRTRPSNQCTAVVQVVPGAFSRETDSIQIERVRLLDLDGAQPLRIKVAGRRKLLSLDMSVSVQIPADALSDSDTIYIGKAKARVRGRTYRASRLSCRLTE